MTKEQILQAINANPPFSFNVENLMDYFHIDSLEDRVTLLENIQSLKESYDLFESKKLKFATREQKGYIKGIYSYKNERFGFVRCETQDYFLPAKLRNGAFDQDEVLIEVNNIDLSCEVVKVLNHRIEKLVGEVYIKYRRNRSYYKIQLLNYQCEVTCGDPKLYRINEDSYVLFNIDNYGERLQLSIDSIIGPVNAAYADINATLISKDISLTYPLEASQEAMVASSMPILAHEGRTDLRALPFVTIDGDDAKDFDDAIYVDYNDDKFTLYVSIADVSTYVSEGGELDKEAYRRATSIYVPGKVIPMLPFELSNGACSLNPNVDRYTITAQIEFDANGNELSYKVYPSIIKSHYRLTYSNVNRLFKNDLSMMRQYQDIAQMLFNALSLSELIHQRRLENGGVDFASKELTVSLDSMGKVDSISIRKDGIAESLIEDFMISANIVVAKLLNDHNCPAVYRVHEGPNERRLQEFITLANALFIPFDVSIENCSSRQVQEFLKSAKDSEFFDLINNRLLRAMSKARYDASCLGHYGLGLQYYCHFTSPIRRYPDLIVHRSLWKYIFNNNPVESNLSYIYQNKATHCSDQEVKATETERDIIAMKCCQYMETKLHQIFKVQITSILNNAMYVTTSEGIDICISFPLSTYYLESEQPYIQVYEKLTNTTFNIGDYVEVKVESIDEIERKIYGELVILNSKKIKKKSKTKVDQAENSKRKKGKKDKKNGKQHTNRRKQKGKV